MMRSADNNSERHLKLTLAKICLEITETVKAKQNETKKEYKLVFF